LCNKGASGIDLTLNVFNLVIYGIKYQYNMYTKKRKNHCYIIIDKVCNIIVRKLRGTKSYVPVFFLPQHVRVPLYVNVCETEAGEYFR
jgi:hypothetical protein